MGRVNWSRVLMGGILAGIVIFASEALLNIFVVGRDWQAVMAAMGRPDMGMDPLVTAVWALYSLILGVAAVWLYAAIRSRYGAGPGTALRAGFAVWVLAYLLYTIASLNMGFFPRRLMLISAAWGLAEILLATLLGAWAYREDPHGAPLGRPEAVRGMSEARPA